MKEHGKAIRRVGNVVFVALLLVTLYFLAAAIGRTVAWVTTWVVGAYSPQDVMGWGVDMLSLLFHYLLVGFLVFVAFIFRTISREETPFVKSVSRRMKLAALFLLIGLVLPNWAGQIINNLLGQSSGFTFFDESNTLVVILSVIIYCFALIFDYGCRLQQENYEIL